MAETARAGPGGIACAPGFDRDLLSRIEDAGLNAAAPPQQRWLDGWLVRFSPGKAQRARCVNAVAAGRLPLDGKLSQVADIYRAAALPFVFRITAFTEPATLDAELAGRGWTRHDDTRVMLCPRLPLAPRPLPLGLRWRTLDAEAFAEAVGQLRGSPAAQRRAHAQRLAHAPVPYRGCVIEREHAGAGAGHGDVDGEILCCGQAASEAGFVGLYDVFTAPAARGQGLASLLCERLLADSAKAGAEVGYLQVDADNEAARHIYRRLGFVDAYGYHYRLAPPA